MSCRDYQQRVVNEKRELDEKLSKLSEFGMTPLFQTLSPEEQGRLNRQHSIMEEYSRILGERVAAFQIENCNMELLSRTGLDDSWRQVMNRIDECWQQACEHMDAYQLTADQAFAVAVKSGVPWSLGGKFGTRPVTVPCSISVVDGRWHVVSQKDEL